MKKIYTLGTIIVLTFILVPQIAFASWWNPFSWNMFSFFHKQNAIEQTQIVSEEKSAEKEFKDSNLIGLENQDGNPTKESVVVDSSLRVITEKEKEIEKIESKPILVKQNDTNDDSDRQEKIKKEMEKIQKDLYEMQSQHEDRLNDDDEEEEIENEEYFLQDKPIIKSFCDNNGNCVGSKLTGNLNWYLSSKPTVHVGDTLKFTIKVAGEESSNALAFIIPQGYDVAKDGVRLWGEELTYSKTFTTEDISSSFPIYAYIKSQNDNYHRRSSGCNWIKYACDDSATLEYVVIP